MTPKQLSEKLVRVANAIDASKNPDRTLVARELQSILAAVEGKSRRASDWEQADKIMPKLEKLVGDLSKAVKSKDDEAANLAGALGGHAGDLAKVLLRAFVQIAWTCSTARVSAASVRDAAETYTTYVLRSSFDTNFGEYASTSEDVEYEIFKRLPPGARFSTTRESKTSVSSLETAPETE